MTNEVDYILLGTIAIAFVVGYLVVSFLVGRIREPQSREGTNRQKASNTDTWETHRHQQEEYHREQERIRREAEERRRRAEQEEASRRTSSSRASTVKNEAYYGRILGLRGRVTWTDVQNQYRELVVQYHPDKVNHLGPKLRALAEQEMKEINEAFEYFKRFYR